MLTDLRNFDLIAVEGVDAAKFLQGQLTCNVDNATPEHSILGAYCNLTGRVITEMRLLPYQSGIYLLCQQGMGGVLKSTLDKYIVFSKAKTHIRTQEFVRFGVHGPETVSILETLVERVPKAADEIVPLEQGFVYRCRTDEPCFELLLHVDQTSLIDAIKQHGVETDRTHWDLAEISSGLLHIEIETQETYTPEILNYDLLGLVDFKKGCYTGQEIIARMHYRGKAKKRLYLGQTQDFVIGPQTPLTIENGKLGEIVRFVNDDNGTSKFLAILPCEAAEQPQSIHLSDANGEPHPLTALQMPTLK